MKSSALSSIAMSGSFLLRRTARVATNPTLGGAQVGPIHLRAKLLTADLPGERLFNLDTLVRRHAAKPHPLLDGLVMRKPKGASGRNGTAQQLDGISDHMALLHALKHMQTKVVLQLFIAVSQLMLVHRMRHGHH